MNEEGKMLDQMAAVFRQAWLAADAEGREGERVTDGLSAVFDSEPVLFLALQSAQAVVAEVTASKGWYEDIDQRTFGDDIALLHSEVSEALEAFRRWGYDDMTAQVIPECTDGTQYTGPASSPLCIHGNAWGTCTEGSRIPKPEGVGSEIADVFIRILDTCHRRGIDLGAEFARKVEYNATRPHRHGGKRL